MSVLVIEFDIRSLRAQDFEEVLFMIASGAFKNHSSILSSEKLIRDGVAGSESDSAANNAAFASVSEGPIVRLLGIKLPHNGFQKAFQALQGIDGESLTALMDGDRFSELVGRWKKGRDQRSEREFRVYSGVVCRFDKGQTFAAIRRDDVRLGAAGFASKNDYEKFGAGHKLLTDMQIRATLDELQSRGLFTSVVYRKRHRYFSTTLSQKELADEVIRHHAERSSRKTFEIQSPNARVKDLNS